MRILTLYLRSPRGARRAIQRYMAGKGPLRFGLTARGDLHNTNPLAPARLTIQIETALGSRTVVTSSLPRAMASAIALALASKGVMADVMDDRGLHTVAELVKRRRRKAKTRAAVIAGPWRATGGGK